MYLLWFGGVTVWFYVHLALLYLFWVMVVVAVTLLKIPRMMGYVGTRKYACSTAPRAHNTVQTNRFRPCHHAESASVPAPRLGLLRAPCTELFAGVLECMHGDLCMSARAQTHARTTMHDPRPPDQAGDARL